MLRLLGGLASLDHLDTRPFMNLAFIQASGWWLNPVEPYPVENYDSVNWDDDIPTIHGNIENVPNQAAIIMNIPL